ncbi:MAG TPA: aminotransferase class IV [Myxococcota bacterium]|nr:aminotransferase class IV [Myxococcota bacterium]
MSDPDRRLWIDGRLVSWSEATVHVLSHSLQRGSLVFDYTSVHETPRGPAIFRLDDHLERFLRSVSIVGLPMAYGLAELRAASLAAARANPGANAFKICAYLPSVEVDVVPMDEHVSVAIAVYHGAKDVVLRKANPRPLAATLSVKIERVRRRVEAHLPTHAKASANYLGAMMAKWAARREGFDEVVLLDEQGMLAEAPTANVFLVDEAGALRTPTLDAVLAGVTRMSVLELAKHEGIAVREESLAPEALYEAPEVFLAASSVGVWPVAAVDGRPVRGGAPGPVSKRLKDRLDAICAGEDPAFAHWLVPVGA